MPLTTLTDSSGHSIRLHVYNGRTYPPIPKMTVDLDITLPQIPNIPCRDDDITVLSYPKSGTHWAFDMMCVLCLGEGADPATVSDAKGAGMLEISKPENLENIASPRLLNTHCLPDMVPKDLIKRKTKFIYIIRNPKDVFVSFFYHPAKMKMTESTHDWNSFFELSMGGGGGYGSWFTYTKTWEKLFADNPDVPVLKLVYEDLKEDLGAGVDKMAEFLGKPLSADRRSEIIERCDFSSMKKVNVLSEKMKSSSKGDEHFIFRKGIIGDWKQHFTVAQNERFDEVYKREMEGYNFSFDKYM